jgi:hypothetical protein
MRTHDLIERAFLWLLFWACIPAAGFCFWKAFSEL